MARSAYGTTVTDLGRDLQAIDAAGVAKYVADKQAQAAQQSAFFNLQAQRQQAQQAQARAQQEDAYRYFAANHQAAQSAQAAKQFDAELAFRERMASDNRQAQQKLMETQVAPQNRVADPRLAVANAEIAAVQAAEATKKAESVNWAKAAGEARKKLVGELKVVSAKANDYIPFNQEDAKEGELKAAIKALDASALPRGVIPDQNGGYILPFEMPPQAGLPVAPTALPVAAPSPAGANVAPPGPPPLLTRSPGTGMPSRANFFGATNAPEAAASVAVRKSARANEIARQNPNLTRDEIMAMVNAEFGR